MEIGRLVLLDNVPANGETWILGRCFELLQATGLRGVLSFSDPMPRRSVLSGSLVMPGHVGTCYQAVNDIYLWRSIHCTERLLRSGAMPRHTSRKCLTTQ